MNVKVASPGRLLERSTAKPLALVQSQHRLTAKTTLLSCKVSTAPLQSHTLQPRAGSNVGSSFS